MTVGRLVAIALIFGIAAMAWFALGGSLEYRTGNADAALGERVEGLWGGPQSQTAPRFTLRQGRGPAVPLEIAGSDITADFQLRQRRKGLLWYATYTVDFDAAYRIANPAAVPATATMEFAFPSYDGAYDGFAVLVDGEQAPVTYKDGMATASFALPPSAVVEVRTGYRTNGLDEWRYLPSPDGVGVVQDFTLTMTTDFTDIDYPPDGVSPTADPVRTDTGMGLTWHYDSLVSGRPIGLVMPKPMNPGPLAARISFFAPVSLLFYFAALVLLTATSGIRLHPVNYAFLAAGFFAFHLLLAYLADHVDINLAFGIASATSVALCVGYLALVIGRGAALREIAVSQFVFLVLFSYSFFFEGFTGLAVTIGSVLTLAYFMAKTGRVDWEQVFSRGRDERAAAATGHATTPAAAASVTDAGTA